ncbi:putative ATP-dependent endonuclease of the OLD family [Nitrosomonas eutropha]|uniref:Putative ATP-dependent endonuclease of the OLD family n=2 Tax=Nitrosomonas eutropha TaxID=916 RepID=A0A1I7FYT8_9PROT|nr:DUF2813 domain-containing protein [Nitrosomonas eutropha]SFU41348.1 putative ATP-dependent endonuclease of the OLD family [Nitrosomonas eutropha]
MLLTKLRIEYYRGIKSLELDLGSTTILIGENNCGKTTVLHALRACLQTLRSSGRASPFDEFDLHFDSRAADPTTAPPIAITLTFAESTPGEWSDEVEQKLGGDSGVIALMPPDDRSRVQLRVSAEYSKVTQDIDITFDFLDAAGKPLPPKNRSRLGSLQQLRPLFYLSACVMQARSSLASRSSGRRSSRTPKLMRRPRPTLKSSLRPSTPRSLRPTALSRCARALGQGAGAGGAGWARCGQCRCGTCAGVRHAQPNPGQHCVGNGCLLADWQAWGRYPEPDGVDALRRFLARKQGVKESKPIVALEEPEAHLHPNAVRALWKTIEDIDGQETCGHALW